MNATTAAPCYRADIADRSGILAPPPADFEPLVGPTRAVVIWRGRRWAEIDPATRRRVAKGREGERT